MLIRRHRQGRLAPVLFPGLALIAVLQVGASPAPPDPPSEPAWRTTRGAAPGYIDDLACASCHESIYTSYQDVAMSKAFYRPSAEGIIEDLGEPFYHPPSARYYVMSIVEGEYRFKRYQLDERGRPINEFEQSVDWILGSGNHSRTYLFRTPGGELFQLPLAWYSQAGSWGMAPGYDMPLHPGVQRMVRRECMFCHNAYPDVPAGSDAYEAPHVFPAELPSGLGCQRCHGPGALHVGFALEADFEHLQAAIVNPGRLDPRRRDDICYGCHMQPSVSLIGVRRFGRHDYSFRPGQRLEDYQVQVDVVEEGLERSERFEINHHPYRLEQSRCFQESAERLSCVTCHDPHRKAPPAERATWYRSRCLGCHQLKQTAVHSEETPGDCIACHMPQRRTRDVIQVTMTDHLIQRGPFGPELVAPLEEHTPTLVDVTFLRPDTAPEEPLAEIYRAATVVRAGGFRSTGALETLERLLLETRLPDVEPWLNLAKGHFYRREHEAVDRTVLEIFERAPEHPLALELQGMSHAARGRLPEALDLLRRATAAPVPRPESFFNLALLHRAAGDHGKALESFQRVVRMRPTLSAAWFHVGETQKALERPRDAAAAYRRALEVEPTLTRAYVALGETLWRLGETDEAVRYLRHGVKVAGDPRPVEEALRALRSESDG